MGRRVAVCSLVVVLGLGARAWAAPAPGGARDRGDELADLLNKTVKFSGFDDPKTTLVEALDNLAKRYDLSFDVDEKAFKAEAVPEVLRTEIAQPNPIPEMNATLGAALKKVLARIPVESGATFVVRREVIEITTVEALRKEIWGEDYHGPMLPLVRSNFEKLPLRDALRELAQQAEYNVVLDSAVAEEAAKTPVTAKLRNAPLDTAVRLLADMADLRSVQTANVLYVTTPEKADALRARLKAAQPKPAPEPARPAEKATKDAAGPATKKQ
ncbi:MAG TPA: hypothetical protein VFE78_03675 [Gemmataceae bacterium]|jgi:hypothetical protein|nr:hypothetical protein [Gemmataceae bacterium]